jgi:DNA topoisomerase-1
MAERRTVKWQTLEWPAGPLFPPAYEPHGVKLFYAGEPIELTPAQEEVASFYAALLDVPHPRRTRVW